MNGYIWLVKAYREALRRSAERAAWCIGEGCYTCKLNARDDVLKQLSK
jgi:hypothetical protein